MHKNNRTILVTGSAGFLGASFVCDLLSNGFKVVGIDNYANSSPKITDKIKENFGKNFKFYKADISLEDKSVRSIFLSNEPYIVVHFAALKSISDSYLNPKKYYDNNVGSTRNLLDSMVLSKCKNIIYSSSAAVYGDQIIQPVHEKMTTLPDSPYAKSKLKCETLIEKFSIKSSLNAVSLRYFNPIGSHSKKIIFEQINSKDGNIIQEIIKTAIGKKLNFKIYGGDYPTEDGTCERDYIHTDDLIRAHLEVMKNINNFNGFEVFNIGRGKPVSVLKLVKSFMKYNNISFSYVLSDKRKNEVVTSYADTSKIKSQLKWDAKKNLKDMVQDSWHYQ